MGRSLTVNRYKKAVVKGNLIANGKLNFRECGSVEQTGNRILKDAEAGFARAILLPNKYDPGRAHLAVYNTAKKEAVQVDVTGFLKRGDRYRLLDPEDFFGPPVLSGTCRGNQISVPMDRPFRAFVVMKN